MIWLDQMEHHERFLVISRRRVARPQANTSANHDDYDKTGCYLNIFRRASSQDGVDTGRAVVVRIDSNGIDRSC
jgi:hypothetical protein